MKDILKNPMFYYIAAPVVIALWPLFVWAVYLPAVERNVNLKETQCEKTGEIITEILTLDAGRLDSGAQKAASGEFNYASCIEDAANSCGISSSYYKFSSGAIVTSSGKKSQSARVSLKELNIAKFAKFLSTIQLRWANLQCTQVKIVQKKDLPDIWDVDLDFKYYY